MGHQLYRMIRDGAPADWTALMRLVALLIADDARDPDDTPTDGSLPWSALPINGYRDKRSGEWRDGLTQRTGASARAISDALTSLARKGYEMRQAIGEDKHGKPVFAAKGNALRFQVPRLPPRPAPDRPHSSATFEPRRSHHSAIFEAGSPHAGATFETALNRQRSHPAVQRSHPAVSKVASGCDPIPSVSPHVPSPPEASAVDLADVENTRTRPDQDHDFPAGKAALELLSGERQSELLDAAMRQLPAGCSTRELVQAATRLAEAGTP